MRPTDIVELLRMEAAATEELHPGDSEIEVMRDGANEIERLRALSAPNAEKHRVNFLTVSENAALKLAAEPIHRAFPGSYGIYHVGSSCTRPDYRDVDVRLIIGDETFERHFGAGKKSPACLDLWFLLCWSISEWMQRRTGLPVDFQIQSMAMANVPEHKGHPRNALFFANSPD